jgi:DNA topoisomerase-1
VGKAERARIATIAIPPAWTEVWISPRADGHILATGRDARGRKQYRYHPRWREIRDGTKYHRLSDFGEALPDLRRLIEDDLARPGLPEGKVVAAVVHLLDDTLIRVGNEEYAEQNESYGLTTLRDDHATVDGTKVVFDFKAKSAFEQQVELRDARLARMVRRCQELPGEDLFQYQDDAGRVVDLTSTAVNEYLRALTGATFTAKDFRTWGGTVTAAEALVELGPPATAGDAKANVLAAVDAAEVAGMTTWALSGRPGNPLAARCRDALCVDSPHTATVQEIHLISVHLICAAVDQALEAGAIDVALAGGRA